MADNSSIEWTDSTWNPVTGCTKVSEGCRNCYAERFAERWRGIKGHPFEHGFDLTLKPKRLEQPLSWKKSRMIFVNSMSDLFHKDIPKSFIDQIFDTMEKSNWHTYQILTKRSNLMRNYLNQRYVSKPAPAHIWFGVSVENSKVKNRINDLSEANCSVRFLSIEPLIDAVGILNLASIHWVIVGGESGYNARPIQKEWVVEIRNQCVQQKTPFFFKQWGGRTPKSGGRLLEGKEWSQFPKAHTKPYKHQNQLI